MSSDRAIAERIRQARVAANLSQADLARHVGVSRTAPSKWEQGLAITRENLAKVAEACGVSAQWLEYGSSRTENVDATFLRDCIAAVFNAEQQGGEPLTNGDRAKIAALLYAEYHGSRSINPESVLRLVNLLR